MIRPLASGIVYKNPKPHLAAVHAWHPSLVLLPEGELVATFDLAQAVESFDYHIVPGAFSRFSGQTRPKPVPLHDTSPRPPGPWSGRAVADGTLVGFMHDSIATIHEGLVNRDQPRLRADGSDSAKRQLRLRT